MANVVSAQGFKFKSTLHGGKPSMVRCVFGSGDAVACFIGDAVKISTTGSDAAGNHMMVAQAAAGDAILGVVVGFDKFYGVAVGSISPYTLHRPASTAMYCSVITDPGAIYEIEHNKNSGTDPVAADIGKNASIMVGSGDTVTGMSAMELDGNTKNTTSTLSLRILRIVDRPDNTLAANAKLEVMINKSQSDTVTTGV